jgi:hypothetical protein
MVAYSELIYVFCLLSKCCKKEAELVSEWKKQGLRFFSPEIRQSTRIQKEIISLVLPRKNRPIPIIPPVFVRTCRNSFTSVFTLHIYALYWSSVYLLYLQYDCINCITKEAGLILEWLRMGFGVYSLYFDHDLSHDIRDRVFRLIRKYLRADPCSASVATCAVLLVMTSFICCCKLMFTVWWVTN